MKNTAIRILLVALAAVFGMAALTYAQAPPDFSKVEIKTTKVADKDRKSTRLNSSHGMSSRMPSSA